YFSNTAGHDKLYKLEMATGKKAKVLGKRALYITGMGQNLYYSDYSRSGYLTKLNLKTLKAEVLVKQPVTNLKISDNYLIYNMNAKEHKLTLSQ
ncbi:DUF5050 domain-containing protein, partial [Lysinibacillus sp. D4B1_S16]|uniref:DUF5050 domain-containing protein n=1 Tax=Lysinibacillus sp. D4B1_S16 TaxID=2941231 RepID=UPI0020BFF2F3